MKRQEMISGSVMFVLGLLTVVMSLQLPIGSFRAAGSGLFPLCLGIILSLLSAIFLLTVILQQDKRRGQAREEDSPTPGGSVKQVWCFLGAVALSTVLLNYLGYLLFAFLLMMLLLRLSGLKPGSSRLLYAALTAAAAYLLFVYWLNIPLPKGWPGI